MADVQPFQALRYETGGGPDVTSRIAPPYDVLSEDDKQAMLAADGRNVVAVDLPHTPPKKLGPAAAYEQAADLLGRWIADGTMVRDEQPAIYAYQQTFTAADGRSYTRRGFVARVRIEEFRASETGIFPHEQTFGGPKEDRLALTRATRCQVSPIFGLFADEGNAITDGLYDGLGGEPTLRGTLGETLHEAWCVTDPGKVEAVVQGMASRPIFIADGHHRYTTALNYMNERAAEGLADDDPARFCMFVCVSMDDPGLVIFPTHRVVTVGKVSLDELAGRLAEAFEINRVKASAELLESQVLANGPGWIGVMQSGAEMRLLMHLKNPGVMDRLEPNRHAVYRTLDVAILHRYIIDDILTPLVGPPLAVEYPHDGRATVTAISATGLDAATAFDTDRGEAAGDVTKLAFLLAPTPLQAVRDVCLAGELMPQKSTFFYPKLATGLTLYPHT